MMDNWFWFTAKKQGKAVRERIPAKTWEEAERELRKLGYTDIKMFDSCNIRDLLRGLNTQTHERRTHDDQKGS